MLNTKLYKEKPYTKHRQERKLHELALLKRQLRQIEPMKAEENKKAIILYNVLRNKYLKQRNEFILHNTRIIYKIIREKGIKEKNIDQFEAQTLEDIITTLDTYLDYYFGGNPNSKKPTPTKEINFITYLMNNLEWKRATECVHDLYTFSFPDTVARDIAAIFKAETEFKKSDKEYAIDDIAKKAKLKSERVIELKNIPKHLIDLNLLEEVEMEYLSYKIEDHSINEERKNKLNRISTFFLALLDERERYIIESYYGINGYEKTYEEIGEELGVSRQRIHQIKNKAIGALQIEAEGLIKKL